MPTRKQVRFKEAQPQVKRIPPPDSENSRQIYKVDAMTGPLQLPEPALPPPFTATCAVSERDTAYSPRYATHLPSIDASNPFSNGAEINPILVRGIRVGSGGTFSFGNPKNVTDHPWLQPQKCKVHSHCSGEYMGIEGCLTCTGLYFQIGANRCFCAMFNMFNGDADGNWWCVASSTSEEISEAVEAKLKAYSAAQGWSPEEVLRQTVVVVGVNITYTQSGGILGPGAGVVSGVLNFLGLWHSDIHYDADAHGFIVKPGDPSFLKILKYDRKAKVENGEDPYARVPGFEFRYGESLPYGEWAYLVEDGEWFADLDLGKG